MARDTRGESFDTDLDDYEYLQDSYMYHHGIEVYERRHEERVWEEMLSTEYEDACYQEDDPDAETYESEVSVEPPPIKQATVYSHDKLFFVNESEEISDVHMDYQNKDVNNTESSETAIAKQISIIRNMITNSFAEIITTQNQTEKDIKAIKDTKCQQDNDLNLLIIKLTKELEAVTRLKSEIRLIRRLCIFAIAALAAVILILIM